MRSVQALVRVSFADASEVERSARRRIAFNPRWRRLSDFGDSSSQYGQKHVTTIAGRNYEVLPLEHPRQVAWLGSHSPKWRARHEAWRREPDRMQRNTHRSAAYAGFVFALARGQGHTQLRGMYYVHHRCLTLVFAVVLASFGCESQAVRDVTVCDPPDEPGANVFVSAIDGSSGSLCLPRALAADGGRVNCQVVEAVPAPCDCAASSGLRIAPRSLDASVRRALVEMAEPALAA